MRRSCLLLDMSVFFSRQITNCFTRRSNEASGAYQKFQFARAGWANYHIFQRRWKKYTLNVFTPSVDEARYQVIELRQSRLSSDDGVRRHIQFGKASISSRRLHAFLRFIHGTSHRKRSRQRVHLEYQKKKNKKKKRTGIGSNIW